MTTSRMNASTFDTTMKRCTPREFAQVRDAIHYSINETLEQAIDRIHGLFQKGIPANGYMIGREKRVVTYLDLAYDYANFDMLGYLIRLNYQALDAFGQKYTKFLWHSKAVDALLDLGHTFSKEIADPDAPFWEKAAHLKAPFFQAICAHGARFDNPVEIQGRVNMPVVRFAAQQDLKDVVASAEKVVAMLGTGTNPNVREADGYSVLHAAVGQGKNIRKKELDSTENATRLQSIALAVVRAGGDIDMVDARGQSALHQACHLGYFNKVSALIDAGANSALKDNRGCTPEDLARGAKRRDVLQLLAASRARSSILDVVARASAAAGASEKP